MRPFFRRFAAAVMTLSVGTTAVAAPDDGDATKSSEAAPEPDARRAAKSASATLRAIKDPMLRPIPRAKRTLTSWRHGLRLVRARSTSLKAAVGRINAASGRSRQALATALPSLTGTGNLTHHLIRGEGFNFQTGDISRPTSIPDPPTTWQLGATARQPLLNLSSWYSLGTAKAAKRAAELSAKDAQRVVLASVAEAIVSVITAERLAEVRRVSLRGALSTLALTRRRARLGDVSAVDVLRAETDVATTRAAIIAADEGVRRAREALGLALGYSDGWGVSPNIKLNQLSRDAQRTCRPERTVEARPDVRAAKANLELAQRNRNAVSYQYFPTLDFVSTFTWFNQETFTNRRRYTWTIGAALTWPIYDGGNRGGSADATQGDLEVAESQLTEARRRAKIEVRQADRAVRVAVATLKVSRTTTRLARDTARLARVSFLNGAGNAFNLVDTTRRLQEARIDVAIKEFEVVRAQVASILARSTCNI